MQLKQHLKMWPTLDMNENEIWRWQQHRGEYLPKASNFPMNIHPSRRTDNDKQVGTAGERGGGWDRDPPGYQSLPFHGKRFMEVEVDDEESANMTFRAFKKARICHRGKSSDSSFFGGATRQTLQRPLPVMRDWSGLSILSYTDEKNIRDSLMIPDNEATPKPYSAQEEQRKDLFASKSVPTKNITCATASNIVTSKTTKNTPRRASAPAHACDHSRVTIDKIEGPRRASAPPQACVHSRVTIGKTEGPKQSSRRHSVDSVPITPDDDNEVCLGEDFVPGNWDVVCGRGKNWLEYVSNRRFRVLVAIYLNEYFETISRTRKSIVINTIVTTIQKAGGEGFVKKKGSQWVRITSKEAREKTSHCLRDCLVDPQSQQNQWSLQMRKEKLKDAQNGVFRSLELMK